ncbi:MAG: T9SS type A sorting domain-containing protein [Ignavibacteriota bacterium]
MKKLLVLLAMLVTMNANGQWVQTSNGMGFDKSIWSFHTVGNYIFAGTWGTGLYISTNNGNNWTSTYLNYFTPNCITSSGNSIFVGADYDQYYGFGGVYRSTNNGLNWAQTSLNNKGVHCLTVSGNYIFAGTFGSGIYRTSNNGSNWAQVLNTNANVNAFAISGNNIFAGINYNPYPYGIFISTNNGDSWTQTALNNKIVLNLLAIGNNIFAGTYTGLYRSTNNGTNWTETSMTNKIINSLAVNGNKIFAGTDSVIYLSTDYGVSWLNINFGFNTLPDVISFTFNSNYIFAGTALNSVWRRPLSEIIGIQNISTTIPSSYSLGQNYPNPFNPMTNVKFSIVNAGDVKIVVYDVQGREVQTLVNERLNAGMYEVRFDGSMLTSGVYFYRLTTAGFAETKRMLLIK